MGTPAEEIWQRVRRLRLEFADRVEALSHAELDAPSACEGWRVRDVVGHLVYLGESTQLCVVRDLAKGGLVPDRVLARHGRRLGDLDDAKLAHRLRGAAGGRFHILGTPREVALGEVLVHANDALGPLGQSFDGEPADAAPVLATYLRLGRLAFHARSVRSVRLQATDVDFSAGHGPEVRGRALHLLLLLANRRSALSSLDGPGVATLS